MNKSAPGNMVREQQRRAAEGTIHFWRTIDWQPVQSWKIANDYINSIAFSPDGQMLASANADPTILLWDISASLNTGVANGRTIRTLMGHSERVRAICFSPDGQTLASGSDEGSVKFWDVHTGECLSSRRPDRPYEWVKISGVTGLTPAQISALKELGAVDDGG